MSWKLLAVVAAFGLVALAGDVERPDLSGTWRNADAKAPVRQLTISASGDSLHVSETTPEGDTEWTCGTTGQQCEIQGAHKASVSAWYNGPTLVVLETRGNNVSKQRLQLSADKSALTLQVISVVPPGRTETVELRKQ